ncbi:MAG: PAS domain S-box protein [Desulfobacteraceae bacterium]|nr:PAS domain S-box protein [Desulfobacteraceae bacterium]
MSSKPTYEELENRVKELEDKTQDLTQFKNDFNLFTESIPDMICTIGYDQKFKQVNPAWQEISGWSSNDLIGRNYTDFVHPDDTEQTENAGKQSKSKESAVINFENRYRCKDNSYKWFSWTAIPIPYRKCFFGIVRDITEHKEINEQLQESENTLRCFIDNFPGIAFISDPKKCVLYANKMLADIYGLRHEDIIGLDFKEYVYSDFYSKIAEQDRLVVEENRTLWMEESVRFKSGLSEWLTCKFPIVKKIGPALVGGFSINITERKQIEEALRESELQFRSTFEQAAVGICHADPGGKFIRLNSRFCEIVRYHQDEMLSFRWQDITHPDDLEMDSGYVRQLSENKIRTYSIEKRFIRKDKSDVWINLTVSLVRKPDGNPKYFIGVIEDINYRKKMEEQLRQSQKLEAVGTLAGGIAHDFNNMLGVITGNISYALNNLGKDDELHKVLSDVQESAKQAQTLTHQLLTFSKGGAPIKKVSDINKLINESAIFSVRGSKADCSFDLSELLWTAETDEGQINQVIGNLIINANQAMPDGGTVTVRTENANIGAESGLPIPGGRYVKIAVEDQGVGISEKHLPNIFEPYYTTKQKGSGLGLATAYSIIKRHGGHITVYSEIDKGTVFNIYLPASLKDVKETENKGKFEHTGRGNILIMDDQELILEMVGRMLNRMGYEAVFATDGAQAVEIFSQAYHQSQKHFDAVILDLTVPGGMGGMETIIELLKTDPNVKAVVSSGYSNDPIMADFKDYGFCGVLAKPYTKDQLSEVLKKIFEEKE